MVGFCSIMVADFNTASYKFYSNSSIQKRETLKQAIRIINYDRFLINIIKRSCFLSQVG